MNLELTVNGSAVVREIDPQELLLDFLRDRLDLKGAKASCEVQVCGACTVLLDGEPVSACCLLAADTQGRDVLTIEGLREQERFVQLEEAFTRHAAVQCGFCTSGMVLSAKALLDRNPDPTEGDVREMLAGHLCRCTGYKKQVEAVLAAAAAKKEEAEVVR